MNRPQPGSLSERRTGLLSERRLHAKWIQNGSRARWGVEDIMRADQWKTQQDRCRSEETKILLCPGEVLHDSGAVVEVAIIGFRGARFRRGGLGGGAEVAHLTHLRGG